MTSPKDLYKEKTESQTHREKTKKQTKNKNFVTRGFKIGFDLVEI